MLVAYDVKPDDLAEGERRCVALACAEARLSPLLIDDIFFFASCSDQVKALTKLDTSELQQLLRLFYEVRKDSDVAVDTDVAPVPEDNASAKDGSKDESSDGKPPPVCRKCRRVKSKCICQTRAKDPKKSEVAATLEDMFQESLVLREEYDELLQPDD
jgi:hypothetical protein